MIFESHAHYDDEAFDADRETLFEEIRNSEIECVINVGADMQSSRNTIELTEKYDFFYGAVGVHPDEVGELDEEKFTRLEAYTHRPKIVAVGEIGLDYYWNKEEKDQQIYWFERQLQLAAERNLPVIIHSRDAAKDTYDVLAAASPQPAGGVIHCFSYTWEMADAFLKLGFHIGIGGVITFKNAKKLKEAVRRIPLERILLETDCPYLAPDPYRGKRNSSLYIPYIAKEIAALKEISYEEVVETTNRSAKVLFGVR